MTEVPLVWRGKMKTKETADYFLICIYAVLKTVK